MKIRQKGEFNTGYNCITEKDGKYSEMMMDFGILLLEAGAEYSDEKPLERVIILLSGEMEVSWGENTIQVSRDNCFDAHLCCINAPRNTCIKMTGIASKTEVAIVATENDMDFKVQVIEKEKIRNEIRGANTMEDCGRRIVRTAMDYKMTPDSNIMFGEDVHFPGRWAGFPSHHHRQPEIYFYKFAPQNGFGLIKIGDEGELIENNDTITIDPGLVHPQVAAPGYAMYFLWIIRHLPGDPYIAPTFEEEHLWVEKPDAKYWPNI